MNGAVPRRGEIWFVRMHTDPPGKPPRPAILISPEARNQNPRANTVLIVPLSTTPARLPTHIELSPGETGLDEVSTARCEDISAMPKNWLSPPRRLLRRLSEAKLREIAAAVQIAMGFPPSL